LEVIHAFSFTLLSDPMRLEEILITPALSVRSKRLPNYEEEVETLYKLATVRNSPDELVDALLQAAVVLCGAGTAGLSLLETPEIFRWTNLRGRLANLVGGSTPRNFSPCGVCLDRNSPQLFAWPARYFGYLNDAVVPIVEAMIIPVHIGDQALGTIWILSHEEGVHFDAEDARIMTGLAEFTTSAILQIHALHFESQARKQAEIEAAAGRTLAGSMRSAQSNLEELVKSRTSELRNLSAQLITSQDEERRRIARDLHDSTGQKLTVLKMDLARIQKQVSSIQEGDSGLAECLSLATEISDEIRTLSYVLHPPMLDELGLISAVQFYVEGINKRQTLEVRVEVASPPGRLAEAVEIALFRVVQAALANVHLHSGSKRATIRIAQDGEKLILEIIDGGHGFTLKNLKKGGSMRESGVGLLGIKERLELIGGRLEIETGKQGTIIRGIIPISSSAEERGSLRDSN
jgi:signal transduction histidine kinase